MTPHQGAGLIGWTERRTGPAQNSSRPRGSSANGGHRVLAIVSGKGGVGKSALAVNLAVSAGAGRGTLLIDGDAGLANADLLMGCIPRHDLADFARGRAEISELICPAPRGVELVVVGGAVEGVRLLESSLAGGEDQAVSRLIASRTLVILDLGAGIGAGVIELARHADPVWLVATPEPTSLADAYSTAKRLWERAPRLRIELVVNRATRESGRRTHVALDRMTRRFLGRPLPLRAVLPDDPAMVRSVAHQSPVCLEEPDSAIARRIALLAESLLEEPSAAEERAAAAVPSTTPR